MTAAQPTLLDLEPTTGDFAADVIDGLSSAPKSLPCKYLYDARGSELFERICALDQYYPTRTEVQILRSHLPAMCDVIGPNATVIEFGAGSGIKTDLLLDALRTPASYVPIEISRTALIECAETLQARHPDVEVLPVCADYHQAIQIPKSQRTSQRRVVFFPGSTLANFSVDGAREFLGRIRDLVGDSGLLLLGLDQPKDEATMVAAYDDREGVTAQFSLNLLTRMNRELGSNFTIDAFRHQAVWNADLSRIEIGLVSQCDQDITVAGKTFQFTDGERIETEQAHKWTPDALMAFADGWTLKQTWADEKGWFNEMLLEVS